MKRFECECCGASVDPFTGICEYCGTKYKIEQGNIIRIEPFHNPVRAYKSAIEIPDYLVKEGDDIEKISKYAVDNLAHNLAEALKPNMDISIEHIPERRTQRVTARIRIVEPKYIY